MYYAFYLYRVPIKNVDRFLRIVTDAAEIYRRYGAVVIPALRLTDGAGRYGCVGLSESRISTKFRRITPSIPLRRGKSHRGLEQA